jgi:pimeloyl-ACP methyl ester carboxylesterase
MTNQITPFTIAISDRDLDDLISRIDAVRWPGGLEAEDWSRGVPTSYLKSLAQYWQSGFDWRKQEAAINALPQFTTTIEGQTFHFIHVKSGRADATPIVLCHGWPGSFVEHLKIIQPLVADGFDVVAPTLPGFGFSSPLASHGWDLSKTTHAYAEIMKRLGYDRYGTHGSDIGAGIAGHLASYYPDRVIGVHVASERNALTNAGIYLPLPADLNEAEKAEVDAIKASMRDSDGYAKQQGTKPQTLSFGLADSPVGQLAWIAEKFKEWTDRSRELPEDAVDRDQLLTNVSVYWFTNTAGSSAQFYWESQHAKGGWTSPSDVPTGWAVFDSAPIVRRVLDPDHKHKHWTDFAPGGHFPAMEQPEMLVGDIIAFFRGLRS